MDPQDADNHAVVVISHDCDIAQPETAEPCVEVIVGRFIPAANGTYSFGKNVRTLHLECTGGASHRVIELVASARVPIYKAEGRHPSLLRHVPALDVRLSPHQRAILQRWLASRYWRSAFPDEFDRRLDDVTDVKARLAKSLKQHGTRIAAVFFDVDGGCEVQRSGPDDVFELRVTLMYSTQHDPELAHSDALLLKRRVEEIFQSRCTQSIGGVPVPRWIELVGVEIIADTAITVADAQQLMKWNADHLSLREGAAQAIFPGQDVP